MESTRQNKFARLIQKELSEIFQRNGAVFYGNTFVTITVVRTTPDLSIAKIYLSLFGVKAPETLIRQIQQRSREIRKMLGDKIKHQVRHIPELFFYLDDSLDYAENIEKLLKGINIQEEK